jgi:hypothetical protein
MENASLGRITGALIALAASGLATACEGPTRPLEVSGTYVLRRIAGEPVPAIIARDSGSALLLLADTLRLEVGGRGLVARSTMLARTHAPADGPFRAESQLAYRVSGSRIEITYVCPPNASCIESPHLIARRTPLGLEGVESVGDRRSVAYERISSP